MYRRVLLIVGIVLICLCSVWDYKLQGTMDKRETNVGLAGSDKPGADKAISGRVAVSDMVACTSKGKIKSGHNKTVYLTFDDGPSKCTESVLDILEENDVCATFFMIGNQINKNTMPTVKRLIKDGNQVGVHTYSHEPEKIYKSADTYYEDVMKTAKLLIKKTDIVPVVYRFPYGSNNCYILKYRKRIIGRLKDEGMEFYDWNVSGEDSIGSPSAAKIIANVKNNYDVYNEPVVLLHDSGASDETVKALPKIIKLYKDAGYSFGLVKDRSNAYQWKVK